MASANLTTLKRDARRYDAWFAAMPFHFSASVGKRWMRQDMLFESEFFSTCSLFVSLYKVALHGPNQKFWADGCCFSIRMKDGWEIMLLWKLRPDDRRWPRGTAHVNCHVNQATAVRELTEWPLWVRHSKMHMHRFTVFLVLQLSLCFFCSFPVRCSWILIVASRGTAWECDSGRVVVLPILKFFENGEIRQRFCCGLQVLWPGPVVEVLRMQSTLCLKVTTKVVCVTMFAEVIGREIISDRHDLGLWSTSIEFVGLFDTWARKNTFIHIPCSSFSDSESEGECAVCSFKRHHCGVPFVPRTCRAPRSRSSFLHFFGARSRSCDDLLWANKKPCASATLHVTTQILRKSFKFRHRNENKWNVVEIGWKYANLGVWEAVKHPLSRPGTLEDRWSFGVQLGLSEQSFNNLRCHFPKVFLNHSRLID